MKNINMSQLFEKLSDIKALFQYGQKIVPVLQSLVDFMQDTGPLLENINHSIAESTAKIPRATDQISNVTNATELATTEILDLVDVISNSLNNIESLLKELISTENKKNEIYEKLSILLAGNPEAGELLKQYNEANITIDSIGNIIQYFPKIKDDTYNITLSLQVQDITSQQLASVTHLIESVQDRLAKLIRDIDDADLKSPALPGPPVNFTAPEGATFDPNASYDKSSDRQDMINDLVQKENMKASQDEIDKLFS
ncbi:MAG: protein phosphatase CheZ [Ignavibacteria bacterium]